MEEKTNPLKGFYRIKPEYNLKESEDLHHATGVFPMERYDKVSEESFGHSQEVIAYGFSEDEFEAIWRRMHKIAATQPLHK